MFSVVNRLRARGQRIRARKGTLRSSSTIKTIVERLFRDNRVRQDAIVARSWIGIGEEEDLNLPIANLSAIVDRDIRAFERDRLQTNDTLKHLANFPLCWFP